MKLKGIDGGPHKRWSMWFNSKQRAEPYQGLTWERRGGRPPSGSDAAFRTGAAWLSSARVVRCWVKSRNERNPRLLLPPREGGSREGLPGTTRRKVRTTSSPHGPYVLGYTRATMAGTEGSDAARRSESRKPASVRIGVCNSTP